MAAAGVYRRPLTSGGTAMGFDEDTVITYAGGSVTVPADQDAVLYPAGTSPVLNLDTTGYCLFIRPGSPILWACAQQDYAAVATAIDIVPRVWSAGADDLWLPPRHVVPPPPPPGTRIRQFLRLTLRNTDEGVNAPAGFLGNWPPATIGLGRVAVYALDVTPGPSNPGGAFNSFAQVTRTPSLYPTATAMPAYQLVSAALPTMTIPADVWTVAYAARAVFTSGADLGYLGYIWIGLASGATIVPVTRIGAGGVSGIFGGSSMTLYSATLAGSSVVASAGDYIVLEIGFSDLNTGPEAYVIDGGGQFLIVSDHVLTTTGRDYLDGPFGPP